MKTLRNITSLAAVAIALFAVSPTDAFQVRAATLAPVVATGGGIATGTGTGASVVAADTAATTALNAEKARINRRYGNTVRWGPVMTSRTLRYDWLGRAYYQTTKSQSYSLGF